MRNIHSSERSSLNTLHKTKDDSGETHFARKNFFRYHKEHSNLQKNDEKKYEVPVHEFEEKFELKAPPKSNSTSIDPFQNMTVIDNSEDMEMVESKFYDAAYPLNSQEVSGLYYNTGLQ